MAVSRVLVADRYSKILAELEVELSSVSWRLNKVGRASFGIAKTDNKATLDNLQFKNRVLIQFDNGLPDWGGVIDTPRRWTEHSIEVNAYSGEHLLARRQTDRGRYFSSASAGYIFERVILEANAIEPTGIMLGTVWKGGAGHSPSYHFKNLLDICRDSLTRRLEDADFYIQAAESSGTITFTGNFYDRRGSDKSNGIVLMEGHNVGRVTLREQGTIVNSWDLAGEGTGWSDDRLMSHSDDTDSINDYGLCEDSRVYADTSIQTTLDNTADNLLAESKQPQSDVVVDTIDLAPALFASYDVGDDVRIILETYGFGGYDKTVRILTREFFPRSGICRLVVEEVV